MESGNVQKNNSEWHKDDDLDQQQKSHSPVKQTDGPRKRADRDNKPHTKPTSWTCGECLQRFSERDSYVSHVRTAHRKVRGHELSILECV